MRLNSIPNLNQYLLGRPKYFGLKKARKKKIIHNNKDHGRKASPEIKGNKLINKKNKANTIPKLFSEPTSIFLISSRSFIRR